ncbi:MAG: MarR family transcriptional regulator [Elusimicrobia bacterium]|nr:MarR family transcriptional regulator [Elusimicrobiota bacterium]
MTKTIFITKNPPSPQFLSELSHKYPDMDLSAVETLSLLLRTTIQILNVTDLDLARHNISRGRLSVLSHLNRQPQGSATPSQLADLIGVTRATVTGLLDALERGGHVTREEGNDARSVLVRLTPKGLKLLEEILPDRFKKVRGLMKGLSDSDRRELQGLLKKVASGLPSYSGK